MENLKGSKTEKNLYKTLSGESRARSKYTFYAEKAEKEGNIWIAKVFRETADNELAHARHVFNECLELNSDLSDDLKDAIEGEVDENENIYKQFEEDARKEGFMCIADFYKELREVEVFHAQRFKDMLIRLEEGMYTSTKVQNWQCQNCGYIHEGPMAPEKCPLCGYPQGYFKILCDDYEK